MPVPKKQQEIPPSQATISSSSQDGSVDEEHHESFSATYLKERKKNAKDHPVGVASAIPAASRAICASWHQD
ncbi:Protein of unknown function [Gryllus bimaculatus]|nr:Protein of unknown function [Gryllus bimaculatus]